MSENLGTVREWQVCYDFVADPSPKGRHPRKARIFATREEAESFATTLSEATIEEILWEKKKHYLIVSNTDPNLHWNFGIGNGEWAKKGSYYSTEEYAQEDIDANHLDAHIEYDIW